MPTTLTPEENEWIRNQAKQERLRNAAPALYAALQHSKRNVEALLYKLPYDASEEKDILSSWVGVITGALAVADGRVQP